MTLPAKKNALQPPAKLGERRALFVFQSQFASLIESGIKTTTIRPLRERMPEPGWIADLRYWSGRPRRSPMVKIGEYPITAVAPCSIDADGTVRVADRALYPAELLSLARGYGFSSAQELLDFFRRTHGLPFTGFLCTWSS